MQGKLLRVLQDGEFHPVGGERPQKVNVRVLVATNKDLERLMEQGKFRQDLYFRVSVVRLVLPPLRDRSEDVPLLVQHFMQKAASASGAVVKSVEASALTKLCGYRWPGNVRVRRPFLARSSPSLTFHPRCAPDPIRLLRLPTTEMGFACDLG
jgi:transcriptional regulator with GAF, ATPase, and Fis domain